MMSSLFFNQSLGFNGTIGYSYLRHTYVMFSDLNTWPIFVPAKHEEDLPAATVKGSVK